MSRIRSSRVPRWIVALSCAVAALWSKSAVACTVCYGDSEAAIIQGAEQATLLMVGVTYLLLGGGATTFVVLRRRARRSVADANQVASSQGASK